MGSNRADDGLEPRQGRAMAANHGRGERTRNAEERRAEVRRVEEQRGLVGAVERQDKRESRAELQQDAERPRQALRLPDAHPVDACSFEGPRSRRKALIVERERPGQKRSSCTSAQSFCLASYSRPSARQCLLCVEKQTRFEVLVQVRL